MKGSIEGAEKAKEIAREYADEECIGEFGEILAVNRDNDDWIVDFRTHTYADEYDHRVRMSRIGNIFKHDRSD